ncbi:glycoside hydrolase family 79 protein [Xylariaceae sp. FL1651]|nr:glycoside hydrolase family 79 protein [Xylariaceae sp. FL1651]
MAIHPGSRLKRSVAFLWLCLLVTSIVLADSGASLGLTISSTPPGNISGPVSPSFAGFGIEPSNLFSFMGKESPNPLTTNLLANLASYTGAPPHIRVGGNTQDNMIYDENMTNWSWIWNPNAMGQGNVKSDSMLIGPRFFEAANRLPAGTPVTWGLNLAYEGDDYVSRLVTMASLALSQTPNISITGFELGNEPDLYAQNGFRKPGTWSGYAYVQEWQGRAAALWQQVLKARNLSAGFFEAAATASTIGTDFQVANLAAYDIGSAPAGSTNGLSSSRTSFLSAWNQHDYYYYIGVSKTEITLARLLQLQTTEDQFAAWATQVRQARDTPYPYALREMGIVGPIGLAGVTDVFGTALWTLNFLLYMASLGVESVQLHMTDNSYASAWQPIKMHDRQPFVRPVYYGVAAFDQVIGGSKCSTKVWQCPLGGADSVPDGYDGFVRAYAVYDNYTLASVVVINGRVSNVSVAEADKPSLDVQLQLPKSLAGQTLHLSYLTGAGADATDGTTWNGISYEKSGDGTPTVVSDAANTVRVGIDGSVSFAVRDTQAIVGTLGQKAGSGTRQNSSICAAAIESPVSTGTSNGGGSGSGNTATTNIEQPTHSSAASSWATSPTHTYQSSVLLFEVSLALLLGVLTL